MIELINVEKYFKKPIRAKGVGNAVCCGKYRKTSSKVDAVGSIK